MHWLNEFLKFCRPVSRLTGSEWADTKRFISLGTTAEPGAWRTYRTPYLQEPMDAATDKKTEKIVLMFASQVGKALSLDTPLPTPAGWTTMGDVKVGDYLFSALGVPCRVVAKTSVMLNHKCYRVVFSDGSEILADAGHKWYVETDYLHLGYSRTGKNNTFKAIKQGVIDTETMRKMHTSVKEKTKVRNNFSIPLTKPLQLPDVDLPVEPYTFGVWLGDGNSYSNQFCGHVDDFEIVENVKADGYALKVRVKDNKYIAIIDPKDKEPLHKRWVICYN